MKVEKSWKKSKNQLAQADTTEGEASKEANVELKQRVASAKAKEANFEEFADQRKSSHKATHGTVQAAAEVLKALEEQQKLTPKAIAPLDVVVRGELETVSEVIDIHTQGCIRLLAKAQAASANLGMKRQELSVSSRIAEDAVEATVSWPRCNSVRAADVIFVAGLWNRSRPVVPRCRQDVVLRRPTVRHRDAARANLFHTFFFFLHMSAKFERTCCQN